MFSRTATGFKAGAVAEGGRSDFATVTELDVGDFAAELGAVPEEALLPAPEAGFVADLLAGLAATFDVADPAGELGTEPADGLDVDGAGFGVCA